MERVAYRFLSLLLALSCLLSAVEAGCGKSDCMSCAGSSSWLGNCRWCRRDNKCHAKGSLGNPCKRAENIVDKSHCEDKLAHYDTKLAYKMLLLSAVAYDEGDHRECVLNALPSYNFEIETVVEKRCDMFDGKCSGYVAVSHVDKVIVVSFRGSQGFGQALQVFLEGISSGMVDFLGGRVQSYWKRAFDELWGSMEPSVRQLRVSFPRYKIWVTGHSLGGTIASLASTWLSYYKIAPRKDIILYTFGMPRVGDYDYAFEHDQLVNNSWRVVNFDDLVPHFPSVANVLRRPYHHGVEVYYTQPATSVDSPHKECHGKPFNEDASCSLSRFPYSIERHTHYFGIDVGSLWKQRCLLR